MKLYDIYNSEINVLNNEEEKIIKRLYEKRFNEKKLEISKLEFDTILGILSKYNIEIIDDSNNYTCPTLKREIFEIKTNESFIYRNTFKICIDNYNIPIFKLSFKNVYSILEVSNDNKQNLKKIVVTYQYKSFIFS